MNKFRVLFLSLAVALNAPALANPAENMADGEIRKVDMDAGKLTIRHGELKNLDMAPMTMVFRVKDKAMLGQVAAGDKVRFSAEKIEGALTVTALEKSTPAR
ncbi:copper-binding protein [Massilia sp. CF038]|uniref:copper-binding protein n=1 Tax=Massilia sp. CF038 TaxID=1881045 RepID=UPI0009132D3C|nr:copper-binding protein [Massilia sp. CF038]SHG66288.1 Cu and Ag efflux protein CusF [Massilia sp. CF038]